MAKKNRAGASKGALSPVRAASPIGIAERSQALLQLFAARDYRRLRQEAAVATAQHPAHGFFWKAKGVAEWCLGEDAVASLLRAAELLPADPEVLANLGNALVRAGRASEGVARLQAALARAPDHPVFLTNLGNALYAEGRVRAASDCHRRAVRLNAGFAEAWLNLAVALLQLPECHGEAIAAAQQAIKINPTLTAAWDCLLFGREYCATPFDADAILTDALRYAEQVSGALPPLSVLATPDSEGRSLRIGLVSGDLRDHVVGRAVANIAPHLADAGAEFRVYANHPRRDEVSEAIASHAADWRDVSGEPDEALAERIRNDRIDVLVDLAGHTQLNRLGVFARRSAPVQVSWLGGCGGAGLPQIDWLIGDEITLPLEEAGHWVEPAWRLPGPYYTLPSRALPIDVTPLPALRNGYLTFGCFNNLAKLSDATIALWARVLSALPTARLILKSREFGETETAAATVQRFVRHGVSSERVRCAAQSPLADYLAAFGEVDVSLDPFPFPGGATTFDSLWMGVPVLTLRGYRFIGHQGETLLTHAGLPEWIAVDQDDYVSRAVACASDLAALATLRSTLRERFLASSLVDGQRNAVQLVEAFRQMLRTGRAVERYPENPVALEAFAAVQLGLERWDVAAEGYRRLYMATEHGSSVDRSSRLAHLAAHIGIARQGAGRFEEAIDCYSRALPALGAEARYTVELNLGVCHFQRDAFADAAAHALAAERLRPGDPVALRNAASALIDAGDVGGAVACYRRGGVDHPLLASGYLYALNFLPEVAPQAVTEAHRRWGSQARRVALDRLRGAGLVEPERSPAPPAGRPWRIGFVSGDWRQHPVGFFSAGLLAAIAADPQRYELHLFSDVRTPDAVTERFRTLTDHWVDVSTMDDLALARRVRADGIDVLIDLGGHAGGRAHFFAGRHAPLQLAWLGYAATSGVSSMDGVLSDRLLDPAGRNESFYVERIHRLGNCWATYAPPESGSAVDDCSRGPRPGPVLASFNRLCKLNPETVACWSALLRALPESRLLLVGKGFDRVAGRGKLPDWLADGGVAADRLDWRGACSFADYLALHREVDLALDCLPWSGHTVTLHAAWMGVPTLAIEGAHRAGRFSAAVMRLLGLDECVVSAGAGLAERFAAQGALLVTNARLPERQALRERLLASPLCDVSGLRIAFDQVLDQAWRERRK